MEFRFLLEQMTCTVTEKEVAEKLIFYICSFGKDDDYLYFRLAAYG